MATDEFDVVVVGGGAAGLSAGVTLARARRAVLVVDAGEPRNAPAAHVHGYLGQEGIPPGDLLAAGRAEVIGYGGGLVKGRVVSAQRRDDRGFRVTLDDGTDLFARRVLVATGLVDELPGIPGVAERWGRDVLHCPYCHGWEVRDQRIAVLAGAPLAVHGGLLWRQWSSSVTVIVAGASEMSDAELEQLAARDVTVVPGEAESLDIAGDRIRGVRLTDGRLVACEVVVVRPRFVARSDLLASLGVELADAVLGGVPIGTHVAADAMGATSVPGVWVAGNVTNLMDQVVAAAAAGVRAAGAVNADLITEDARLAVAARTA